MAEQTKIQWCHHTFNPWRGCSKVHAGCANCYAEREAKRFPKNRGRWGPNGTRVRAADAMWREPLKWNAAAKVAGERRRVFCASLADVFEEWPGPIVDHNDEQLFVDTADGVERFYLPTAAEWRNERNVPATMHDLRDDLFRLIDRTPWLDWLLVTKRPENIGRMWVPPAPVSDLHERRDNVWLLTSVSDQETADLMIPRLIEHRDLVPVLGVSAEPILGRIDFTDWIGCTCSNAYGHCMVCLEGGLDWIIVGGESGPKARHCDHAWLASAIDQCQAAGVACFVKQLGSNSGWNHPTGNMAFAMLSDKKGGDPAEWPESLRVRQFPEVALKGACA